MNRETRTVCYDEDLNMEAYHLEGLVRPFPSHFHEHYVIGYVEEGRRHLKCGTREFLVRPGDVILFNPGDSHCCIKTVHIADLPWLPGSQYSGGGHGAFCA